MKKFSKHLELYEDPAGLFEKGAKMELAAYKCKKMEGITEDQDGWRLLLQVPMKHAEKSGLKYTYECHTYTISEKTGKKSAKTRKKWEEDVDAGIEITSSKAGQDAKSGDGPAGWLCFSLGGKLQGKEQEDSMPVLLQLDIYQEQTLKREIPKWLKKFDSRGSNNYFTRTFNLIGFYDVLFRGGDNFVKGDKETTRSHYLQIPILFTGIVK